MLTKSGPDYFRAVSITLEIHPIRSTRRVQRQAMKLPVGTWTITGDCFRPELFCEFLVLDELTSALDAKAKFDLFTRYNELAKGRTAALNSQRSERLTPFMCWKTEVLSSMGLMTSWCVWAALMSPLWITGPAVSLTVARRPLFQYEFYLKCDNLAKRKVRSDHAENSSVWVVQCNGKATASSGELYGIQRFYPQKSEDWF